MSSPLRDSSCYVIVDYCKLSRECDFDDKIKAIWEDKVREIIKRNPSEKTFLEGYLKKELSTGGSFYNIRKTYSEGLNKFFILVDDCGFICGFAGISRYYKNVYEINKFCSYDDEIIRDFLVKKLIQYFKYIRTCCVDFKLQTVVERKNVPLLNCMIKNGFVKFKSSKWGVNVYLEYEGMVE